MTTTIDQLITAWTDAERMGDAATLDRILTDDFVGIGPVGFVLDKAIWLSRFDMGLAYEALELDEVSVHRHGDAAFVVARQRATGTAGGNPTPPDTRVAFTVVAEASEPRIAGLQYSFIAPPLGAPA